MKKLFVLFALMLFVIANTFGQSKIVTPPLGLSFGMSKQQVKAILKNNGTLSNESTDKCLFYLEIKIGNNVASYMLLSFVNDKLYECGASFQVSDNMIQSNYDTYCKIISDKYGEGRSRRDFRFPYEDGDEYFVSAVKGDYTNIMTIWEYATTRVLVCITTKPFILILYADLVLRDVALKIEDSKNNKDF